MLHCKRQRKLVKNINIFYLHMLLHVTKYHEVYVFPCGLVVRISGSHPGGPGSIPGKGDVFWLFTTTSNNHYKYSRTGIYLCLTLQLFVCCFSNYLSNILIPFNEQLSHQLVDF